MTVFGNCQPLSRNAHHFVTNPTAKTGAATQKLSPGLSRSNCPAIEVPKDPEPLQLPNRAAAARAIAGEQVLGWAIVDLQDLGGELPVASASRIPVQTAAVLIAGAIRSRDERRSCKGFHFSGRLNGDESSFPRDRAKPGRVSASLHHYPATRRHLRFRSTVVWGRSFGDMHPHAVSAVEMACVLGCPQRKCTFEHAEG